MRSIQRYVLCWMICALILGGVMVGLMTYVVTLEEMSEVFDSGLKNVAEALGHHQDAGYNTVSEGSSVMPTRTDEPKDVEIVTLTWTREGRLIYSSDARVNLPFSIQEGLAKVTIGNEEWIVYSSVGVRGVAQAAQRTSQRRFMAGESASEVFPPMVILVFVVGGLLIFGLRRGLAPLNRTAREVAIRSAASMDAIPTREIPREILPLVHSLNDLLARLSAAFSTQRRFLADAAHELRTPITALRLQVQLLQSTGDPNSRAEAGRELSSGINRVQRLIHQLLQVARAEADGGQLRLSRVDLSELVRDVVTRFSLKAEQCSLDIGAALSQEAVVVEADEAQIAVLLENLVENALRYTPSGGVIDVVADVLNGCPRLGVLDTGPGIAEAERERVFDRFYRGEGASALARDREGSGLGLAIVRTIALRHGAHVSLHSRHSGPGLEVWVTFRCAAENREPSRPSGFTK